MVPYHNSIIKGTSPVIGFLLSQTQLLWNLAHLLANIQEDYFDIVTSTIVNRREFTLI